MIDNIARAGFNQQELHDEIDRKLRPMIMAERSLGFQDLGISSSDISNLGLIKRLEISPEMYTMAVKVMEMMHDPEYSDNPLVEMYRDFLSAVSTPWK